MNSQVLVSSTDRRKLIWAASVSSSERLLLLCINEFVGGDGLCWPGITTLSKMAVMEERTITKLLKGLSEKGVIIITARFDDNGRQTSNLYSVDLLGLEACSGREGDRRSGGVPKKMGAGLHKTVRGGDLRSGGEGDRRSPKLDIRSEEYKDLDPESSSFPKEKELTPPPSPPRSSPATEQKFGPVQDSAKEKIQRARPFKKNQDGGGDGGGFVEVFPEEEEQAFLNWLTSELEKNASVHNPRAYARKIANTTEDRDYWHQRFLKETFLAPEQEEHFQRWMLTHQGKHAKTNPQSYVNALLRADRALWIREYLNDQEKRTENAYALAESGFVLPEQEARSLEPKSLEPVHQVEILPRVSPARRESNPFAVAVLDAWKRGPAKKGVLTAHITNNADLFGFRVEGDSIVCSLSGEVLATLPTDAQPFQLPAAQATTKRRARYPDLRELEASFGTKNPVPVDESGNAIYPDIDVDAQAVEVDDE